MKIRASQLLLAFALIAICSLLSAQPTKSAASVNVPYFDGQSWWKHIQVLADDKFEGRDTGSRGERGAEEYAVEQLKSAGAQNAGSDGYNETV